MRLGAVNTADQHFSPVVIYLDEYSLKVLMLQVPAFPAGHVAGYRHQHTSSIRGSVLPEDSKTFHIHKKPVRY